jgi:predicted AlkP superfamily phosphohydrolase/phosphomutase
MSDRPLLVVGLDGVDLRYLDQFADRLPTIGRLREGGVTRPLRSTHPPWTGSAWPSLYTGVDASHHGVYGFFDYRDTYPGEASVVTRNTVRAPAIWDYLTALGRRSIVLNVPVTHPPRPLEGILIPGYLAPADTDGYPEGVRDRLSEAVGEPYAVYSDHETEAKGPAKIDGYERLIESRGRAAAHLLATEEWDFAMVQVQKTDAVFHNSDDPADFERIYRATDDLIARLLDACGTEPNVVLCSDHGMGPITGYSVYVNQLLADAGLVEVTAEPKRDSLDAVKEGEGTDAADEDGSATSLLSTLVDLSRRVGVEPASVYRLTKRLGVSDLVVGLLPKGALQTVSRGVDWRASAAYCRDEAEQGIRLNLAGRDPDGVVHPDEYESVRDEVIRLLSALETPEGDPVFDYVRRREEVFDGPYLEDAPDVLFRTTEMNHLVSTAILGDTLVPADTYNHKELGAFVASGPDVGTDWDAEELSILDVAPLVFALLGEAVPERLAGQVPQGLTVSTPERVAYDEVDAEADADYAQDQGEVTDRLRDLGYL